MALFSNPFKSPKNIIDSDSGDWICPRCGVIVNLTDVTRCVCGYDKTAPPPPTKTTPTKTTPAIPQEDKSTISEKDSLSIKNIYERYKAKKIIQRLSEEQLYEIIYYEIEQNEKRPGLWMKAIAQSGGDENRAVSIYVLLRLQAIKDELEIVTFLQ